MPKAEQITQSIEWRQGNSIIEAISTSDSRDQAIAEVVHDARNMIAALDLYCDLLQEPGVLALPYAHYSGELRLVAAASRRLMDKLVSLQPTDKAPHVDLNPIAVPEPIWPLQVQPGKAQHWNEIPEELITNLAEEVLANRSLLSSLAGPTIALTVDADGGALPVRMTGEDLTRILVNLVKNSTKAMSALGRIHISIWESGTGTSRQVVLNVEDNGPGIGESVIENLFQPRIARRPAFNLESSESPRLRRGLGLAITRSLVEAAGGAIHAINRLPVGASIRIELPVCPS